MGQREGRGERKNRKKGEQEEERVMSMCEGKATEELCIRLKFKKR